MFMSISKVFLFVSLARAGLIFCVCNAANTKSLRQEQNQKQKEHRVTHGIRGQAHEQESKGYRHLHHRRLMVDREPSPEETCANLGDKSKQCGAKGNAPQTCCSIDAICDQGRCVDPTTPAPTTSAPTTPAPTTPAPTTPVPTPTQTTPNQDSLGISMLYATDEAKQGNDWFSDWSGTTIQTLDGAFQEDPDDARCMMRGSGEIAIGNDKIAMRQSPRFYIEKSDSTDGWENVEFTAYGRYVEDGEIKSYSGLTMGARTNHGDFGDGCTGAGYYARIYRNTGEVSLQKEFYHGQYTVYSATKRVPYFNDFPVGELIGIKFVVYTSPSASSDVQLEIYLDQTGGVNGGDWTLVHSFTDTPQAWQKTSSSNAIPETCEVQSGDTVLGSRQFCMLRTDGDTNTLVEWEKASIRNIVPTKL